MKPKALVMDYLGLLFNLFLLVTTACILWLMFVAILTRAAPSASDSRRQSSYGLHKITPGDFETRSSINSSPKDLPCSSIALVPQNSLSCRILRVHTASYLFTVLAQIPRTRGAMEKRAGFLTFSLETLPRT